MVDRNIPFHNVIMRCDSYTPREPVLPQGFHISTYQPGDEKHWARMEYELGDFGSAEEAEEYFVATYLGDEANHQSIFFARNYNNEPIGSCIAWHDQQGHNNQKNGRVSSLHWLVVKDEYQEKGIGRALTVATMNRFLETTGLPVYIHTQPWSWKAILLYADLGFTIQRTDTFANYTNDYHLAMETLRPLMTPAQFKKIHN